MGKKRQKCNKDRIKREGDMTREETGRWEDRVRRVEPKHLLG